MTGGTAEMRQKPVQAGQAPWKARRHDNNGESTRDGGGEWRQQQQQHLRSAENDNDWKWH